MNIWATIRDLLPPNRMVAVLTPFAAAAAGWLATWVAETFPGINVTEDQLAVVFIGGVVAVVTMAYKWLDGWQKYEGALMEIQKPAARRDWKKGQSQR